MTDGDEAPGTDSGTETGTGDDDPGGLATDVIDDAPANSTNGSRVIAIASGKGGVGKTTTAVTLAAAMASAGRSVVVVDFDLGMANVADFVDLGVPDATLHDVLAGDADLEDAIVDAPGGFSVVPGGTTLADFGKADPAEFGDAIATLRGRYDVVLVDTGAGLSHDTSLPLGLADDVVLVTTAQAASLANTRKTRELADHLDGTVTGVVVTRVGGTGDSTDVVEERFDLPLLGVIPEDSATAAAAAAGSPLLKHAPESPASQAYRELAYELLGEDLPLDFREDAAEPDEAGPLVEDTEGTAEPDQPGLLARLTGGLVGGK